GQRHGRVIVRKSHKSSVPGIAPGYGIDQLPSFKIPQVILPIIPCEQPLAARAEYRPASFIVWQLPDQLPVGDIEHAYRTCAPFGELVTNLSARHKLLVRA